MFCCIIILKVVLVASAHIHMKSPHHSASSNDIQQSGQTRASVLEIKKISGRRYAKCGATKPLSLVALMTAWLPIQLDPT